MSKLGQVVESIEKHNKFVLDQVKRARTDEKFGRELLGRWNDTKAKIPVSRTPTGLPLPRLALPEIDEPGEIARYLFGEGLPGEFPFLNGAYREMYLEPVREVESFEKNGEPYATTSAAAIAPSRRADAFVLRLDARRGYQRAFSLSHRSISARTGSAPLSMDLHSMASTATRMASLEKSARAAWRSTRSKTWCGFTMVLISAHRIFPRR